MNKNLIDSMTIVIFFIIVALLLSILTYSVIMLDGQSQTVVYQGNDGNEYYNQSNNDYVYFVYDDVPHLLVLEENSTYISYIWVNSSWILTETKFESPNVSNELIIPPLTWDHPIKE